MPKLDHFRCEVLRDFPSLRLTILKSQESPAVAVIKLVGHINDPMVTSTICDEFARLIENGVRDFAFDCSELTYLSDTVGSAPFLYLFSASKKAGGTCVLSSVPKNLDYLNRDHIVELVPRTNTVEEALIILVEHSGL